MHNRKAKELLKSNIRKKSTRSNYKYVVGDYAYVTTTDIKRIMSGQNEGPFRVNVVCTNGTLGTDL